MNLSKDFILAQKTEIEARLAKYNNRETIEEQLRERGDITLYQRYKIDTVSPFLRRALDKIEKGIYGICEVCGRSISTERLKIVPGALAHVECDPKKKSKENR